jgi:hypothetical protein
MKAYGIFAEFEVRPRLSGGRADRKLDQCGSDGLEETDLLLDG